MTELPVRVADVTALPRPRVERLTDPAPDGTDLVTVGDEQMPAAELARRYISSRREIEDLRRQSHDGGRALKSDAELRPWQVELLKLQRHLEAANRRMIVLF